MARKVKQSVQHVVKTDRKREIIQKLLQEYDIESAEDIQDALKENDYHVRRSHSGVTNVSRMLNASPASALDMHQALC